MKLLKTAFHLQCKIEKGSNINHIVMKFNPYETAAIPYLKVSLFFIFAKYVILEVSAHIKIIKMQLEILYNNLIFILISRRCFQK